MIFVLGIRRTFCVFIMLVGDRFPRFPHHCSPIFHHVPPVTLISSRHVCFGLWRAYENVGKSAHKRLCLVAEYIYGFFLCRHFRSMSHFFSFSKSPLAFTYVKRK